MRQYVIILKRKKFGIFAGVIMPKSELKEIVRAHRGEKKILVDNNSTLMYELID